jgi:peptidoglycan hydrolase-like protein with peptidoglycan-binding domain
MCPFAEPTINLSIGNTGDGVKWIQWHLAYKFRYTITIDGTFGTATDGAIRHFQSTNGLVIDGIVGPLTRAKLKA